MTPEPDPAATLDLDAYLARVGYHGPLAPDARTLSDLHLAHATHVPFENLDVLLGTPPRLDLGSLQAKLVGARRGGYCFEQNALFAAVLERLGFAVTRLAARVWYRTTHRLPRTHMLLRVDLPGGPVAADVGFGAEGPFLPYPLAAGAESPQFNWTYRVVRRDGHWLFQLGRPDGWSDLYEFTEEPQHPEDYEPPNHYVATHPASRFTHTLIASLPTPAARFILRGRDLVTDRGGGDAETRPVGEDELPAVLERTFGLRLPPGARLPPPAG